VPARDFFLRGPRLSDGRKLTIAQINPQSAISNPKFLLSAAQTHTGKMPAPLSLIGYYREVRKGFARSTTTLP
jgi:hypothetical protein